MASTTDGCCLNDPNFAVICSFINNFGDKLILPEISFEDLQESLEDTKAVSDLLVDLHVHLLRRIGKKVTIEKWQRSVIKFCHYFDNADAWEIEQNGYEKAKVSTKLKVLKNLLETQFDLNLKFKEKIGELDPVQLRCQPLGRDINGGSYWYLIDKELNLRIYREEHPTLKEEDEVWKVICRDRDDLATLVATLDAEINPNTDNTQDPKIEGSIKEDEKEDIVKEEETDSSKYLEQNESGTQSDNKNIITDKIAGVESSPVKDVEIKKDSESTSVKSSVKISNCKKEESITEDSCVKVEPQDDIPESTEHVKQGEDAENFKQKEEMMTIASEGVYETTSECNDDKIHKSLENKEKNDIKKGNTDSTSESKAEKRKLEFSEETEIESKSRKECSENVLSGSHKISSSNCKSERLSETAPKGLETTSANLRRESVIKIGKRLDKISPQEESAKQNPSENKEKLPKNKLAIPVKEEKEMSKSDDIVIISDIDKDIEAAAKNQELIKRMNEINKSADSYKLKEKVNVEMNKNIQYDDDENIDDKIVLMKEYTKSSEQINFCKERVPSPAIVKPYIVTSEEKMQNLQEVKAMPSAKTSGLDKVHDEDHISEAKKTILEENVNKLHSVGDCAENVLPKKGNIEQPEKESGFVTTDDHSQNKESKGNWKSNLSKKENQLQNNDDNSQKPSEDAQKEVNVEKNLGHKFHHFENESSKDDTKFQSSKKHLKSELKPLSDEQKHKSQNSDKELHAPNKSSISEEPAAENKPYSSEGESSTRSKSHSNEGKLGTKEISRNSEKKPGTGDRSHISDKKPGTSDMPCSSKENPIAVDSSCESEKKLDTRDRTHSIEEEPDAGSKSRNSEKEPSVVNKSLSSKGALGADSKSRSSEEPPGTSSKSRDSEVGNSKSHGSKVTSNKSCSEELPGAGSKSKSSEGAPGANSKSRDSDGADSKSRDSDGADSKSRGSDGAESKSRGSDGADSKSRGSDGADSKSRDSNRADSKSRGSEDTGSKSRSSDGAESESRGSDGADSKSHGSDGTDSKSRGSDGTDSKSRGSDEADSKSRGSDEADSKSRDSDEANSKSRDSNKADSKSRGSEGTGSKSRSSKEVSSKSCSNEGADSKSHGSEGVSAASSKSCSNEELPGASIKSHDSEGAASKSSSSKGALGASSKSCGSDGADSKSCGSDGGDSKSCGKGADSKSCGSKGAPGTSSKSHVSKESPGASSKSRSSKGADSKSHGNESKPHISEEVVVSKSESCSRDKLLDIENKSSNKDKTMKIPNDCKKQLDEKPKVEVSQDNESQKSTSSLPSDELAIKNTDDQHHSENSSKLKFSLDKMQTTINEDISAGNEEKKLTCKIVIKRSSRKKDCVSDKDANAADEADNDSDEMAKNTDDIEYKCELSSVPADDKTEESENTTNQNEKNDCIQRVRKRKACDKLPITPSKNDRKTAEDISNEEHLEQIPNNDKDVLQDVNKNSNRELDSKDGFSDTEESNVRTSRRLRARRTKSSSLETEKPKTELPKEVETTQGNSGQNPNPENEVQVTKKTRARRRTQAELICTDLIIPEEEKRTRGRKRQNTIAEEFTIGEALEEIEPKKVKGSKNFRKTNTARLKDTEEQFSSQSDSDDMPLSKMTKATTRGRARGRGRSKNSRQPFTVLEEPVSTTPVTRKSSRTAKKKEFNSNDFDTSRVRSNHGTGKSLRGGSSTAGKGSRGRQRKKRSGSVESDKWVSDKTEGEEEEDDDDEEEEELFVGELLRRSSRVRSLGTKNKLLCISTSSDEDKSETNEDTSDEEFQLPKGRNARRAAARSAGTKEAQKIEENDNDKPCCHCQKFDRPETILLCDKCDAGYHTLCLTPPLHIIPEGDWFCPPCEHKMLLEKLMTHLHELDLQLKKRERLMKRKERLAFVGISLDNILSERKENMEPNVDCPNQSSTRTCRARRSINYKFTEFDELIDSAIQDDLRTVTDPDIEGATEDKDDSSQNGKDMSNITNSIEGPVSRGKDMDTIMTVYNETNDLRPQGIQAKKEAVRRRGKDISNLVGKGSDSDEQYPAPRRRRPKRKLTTLDSDSYASESDEYKASEDSDVSVDVDASEYSEEEEDEDDDDDDEDYGTRRRSSRTSTRQNYRASRKSGRGTTRRSRRQNFDDFVVDDDYDSEESANYRRSTRASVKRKVNYRERASDEEEEMTPTEGESEESSAEFSELGSDDSVEPNKKLKLKLAKKKTKRIIRESLSDDDDDDDDDDKSSRSSDDEAIDKNKRKLTRKRRLAVSDSESSSSSHSESGVRRSCRASTQKMNFKKLLDSDSDDESGKIERPYTVTKQKKNAIMSDSDSIASDDKSSIKSVSLDKKDNDSKFSHAADVANDDSNNITTVTTTTTTISTVTTPSTSTTTTTNNNNSHEAHLKENQQNDDNTVDSSFSQMNGHDNEKDKKDTHLEKTENRTIAPERHQEDNCNNDSTNDDTSHLGTSTSRSGPQVLP